MLNVNFVPDDYVKSSENRRTNLMYLVLLAVVMTGLFGSFITIKMRQQAIKAKEKYLSKKAVQAQEAIEQFEALQANPVAPRIRAEPVVAVALVCHCCCVACFHHSILFPHLLWSHISDS